MILILFIPFTVAPILLAVFVASSKHRSALAWGTAAGVAALLGYLAVWLTPWLRWLRTSPVEQLSLAVVALVVFMPLLTTAPVLYTLSRLPELNPRQRERARTPQVVTLPECVPGVFLDAFSTHDFPCVLVLGNERVIYLVRSLPDELHALDRDTLIHASADGDVLNLGWQDPDGQMFKGCFRPLDETTYEGRSDVSAALARRFETVMAPLSAPHQRIT